MGNQRMRSPKYPSIGLSTSIEKAQVIVSAYNRSSVDRDAIAKAMGYAGVNGTSAPVIGALVQFGLLEYAHRGEVQATELATRILWAESQDEKDSAVKEAALHPEVFNTLYEKFGAGLPQMQGITNYLLRQMKFSDRAANSAAKSYLETIQFAHLDVDSVVQPSDVVAKEHESRSRSEIENTPTKQVAHSFEFNDWMRLPIDESLTVRIQTNTKQDLLPEQLEYLIEVLQLKLKRLPPISTFGTVEPGSSGESPT